MQRWVLKVHELENFLSNVPDTAEVRFFLGGEWPQQLKFTEGEGGLIKERCFLSDQPYHIDLFFEEMVGP